MNNKFELTLWMLRFASPANNELCLCSDVRGNLSLLEWDEENGMFWDGMQEKFIEDIVSWASLPTNKIKQYVKDHSTRLSIRAT